MITITITAKPPISLAFSPSICHFYTMLCLRIRTLCFHATLGLALFAAPTLSLANDSAIADEVDAFAPNKSITEEILAFGNYPEAAERAAMIRAWKIAHDGVYKIKNISLGTVDGEDYCILKIDHEVYEPPDTKRVGEMAVGFGSDPQAALRNAQVKALQRIRDNPRARPNFRNSTLPVRSQDYLPMPKEFERDFIETNIRFWGRDGDWRVYLKFAYLEMK